MHSFVTYPISLIENGNIVGGLILLAAYVLVGTTIILLAYDKILPPRFNGYAKVLYKNHTVVEKEKKSPPKPVESGQFVAGEKDPNRWTMYIQFGKKRFVIFISKKLYYELGIGDTVELDFTQSRLRGIIQILETRKVPTSL